MKKKQGKKESVALTKRYGQEDALAVQPTINGALTQLAVILSQDDLAPETLASCMAVIRDANKALTDGLEKQAKVRMIALLKEKGSKKTDKGSLELEAGGWSIVMQPYRTGLDPKKLEGVLRAKGIDPAKWMTQTISYAVNTDKARQLLDKKILSADDVENCQFNESWTVKTPVPL